MPFISKDDTTYLPDDNVRVNEQSYLFFVFSRKIQSFHYSVSVFGGFVYFLDFPGKFRIWFALFSVFCSFGWICLFFEFSRKNLQTKESWDVLKDRLSWLFRGTRLSRTLGLNLSYQLEISSHPHSGFRRHTIQTHNYFITKMNSIFYFVLICGMGFLVEGIFQSPTPTGYVPIYGDHSQTGQAQTFSSG